MSNFLFYSLVLNQLNKMVQISPQAFVVFFFASKYANSSAFN